MSRVLIAGDSLALGLSKPLTDLGKARNIAVMGDGRTSTTAAQWVTGGWLAKDIATFQPDVTLISLGTNDATGDLSQFATHVSTLIDQATSQGGSVAWISPPYLAPTLKNFPTGAVDRVRQTLLDTLTPHGITIFPSDSGGAANDYARAADGIHMQPSGYAAWAKDIADFAGFTATASTPAAAASVAAPSKKWVWWVGGAAAAGGLLWLASRKD